MNDEQLDERFERTESHFAAWNREEKEKIEVLESIENDPDFAILKRLERVVGKYAALESLINEGNERPEEYVSLWSEGRLTQEAYLLSEGGSVTLKDNVKSSSIFEGRAVTGKIIYKLSAKELEDGSLDIRNTFLLVASIDEEPKVCSLAEEHFFEKGESVELLYANKRKRDPDHLSMYEILRNNKAVLDYIMHDLPQVEETFEMVLEAACDPVLNGAIAESAQHLRDSLQTEV